MVILVSFLAREVFVGALGILFGVRGADENITELAAHIQHDGLVSLVANRLSLLF
ncbi:MAG: ferrous iron transport protein B [Paraglaciecola sp.]